MLSTPAGTVRPGGGGVIQLLKWIWRASRGKFTPARHQRHAGLKRPSSWRPDS